MKSLQTLALLIAFITVNASAVTVIKESRTDEDIKFVTSPGGVPTEQGKIDGATGNLGFDDITNAAGSGAPNFPFGATGISASITDFTVQSIADPTLTLNGGVIRRGDGREILTYDGTGTTSGDFGTNITANLDTVLGSAPSDATTYYLYINLGSLTETILTDNNRTVFGVTEDNLVLSTSKPTDQGTAGFLYLATITSATTGNAWSGAGSSFVSAGTKSYQTPNVNVSPTVYAMKQDIASVGTLNNTQGIVDGDFPTLANVRYFFLGDDANDDSANGDNNLTADAGIIFDGNAAKFDGASRIASAASSFYQPGLSADFGFGGWFKINWQASSEQPLLSLGDDANTAVMGIISNTVNGIVVGDQNTFIITIPTDFKNGEWHHVALLYDDTGNSMRLYIDGFLASTATPTQVSNASQRFAIGARAGTALLLDTGEAKDVFYVNGDLLTDAEVLALYSRFFDTRATGKQIKAGHVLKDDSFPVYNTELSFYNLNADALDDSTNSRSLTNNASIPFTGTNIFGESGAASFNGSTQYFSSTDAFFNPGGPFSVGAWVSIDNLNNTVISQGFSNSDRGFVIDTSTSYEFVFRATNAATPSGFALTVTSDPVIVLGQWIHVAMSYDGSTLKGYVNGELAATGPLSDLRTVGTSTFNLMATQNGVIPTQGKMEQAFFARRALSDAEIKKLYSTKITHSKSVLPQNQQWYATFFKGDDDELINELDQDFLLDKKKNFAFIETGLSPEDSVVLRMQNQSQNTTTVVADTFTTGLLSSDPGPVAHGLACNIPSDYYVLLEGATTAGDFDKRYDLCTAKTDGTIACTLPTVDATHRAIIEASCAPIGTSVDVATNPQMLIQRNQSTSDVIVPVDHSLYRPDVEIQAAHTYTINGKWNSVGEITGSGTINGTGELLSIDTTYDDADGFQSGLLPKVTSMSDELATQLGFKEYTSVTIGHTNGYSGFSGSARLLPYQTQAGDWRLKGNITSSWSSLSTANVTLTVDGVVFESSQAIAWSMNSSIAVEERGFTVSGTNTISLNLSSSVTVGDALVSLDVALSGKPSWAF